MTDMTDMTDIPSEDQGQDQGQAQTSEYNCGPTALSYFLALHGHQVDPIFLEGFLEPTEELGTDPANIELFLMTREIPYQILPFEEATLPALVNVNHEQSGDHYMVVLSKDKNNNLTLWDPYYGDLAYWAYAYFKMNHYSPLKKLKGWTLCLVAK